MLGATLYELPPQQGIAPYHYEYGNEEWLIVLTGRPSLRYPGGEEELAPGDVVCFPAGPEGGHKVSNQSGETVRVLMMSTQHEPVSKSTASRDPRPRSRTRRGGATHERIEEQHVARL
jgi:uncharacterized cupin superfamily protein